MDSILERKMQPGDKVSYRLQITKQEPQDGLAIIIPSDSPIARRHEYEGADLITPKSPLGKALTAHFPTEEFTYNTPDGIGRITILDVSPVDLQAIQAALFPDGIERKSAVEKY